MFREGFRPSALMLMNHPKLMKFLNMLGIETALKDSFHSTHKFVSKVIGQHQAILDQAKEDEYPQDFIFAYLKKMLGAPEKSSFYSNFGHINLRSVLIDLFLAGTETTATTLSWAVLFLAKHHEVQKKAQQEIDRIVGRDRLPTLADRADMPYVDAFIHEVQRRGNILGFGVPHAAAEDVEIGGYVVPQGCTFMFNLGAIMHDPVAFPDPFAFKPERFLSSDGKKFIPHPQVIPFGIGKRRCLGEALAKMTLFLFIGAIIHTFHIEHAPEGGEEELSEAYVPGGSLGPKPYKFRMTLR